jgi:hypothetical protein
LAYLVPERKLGFSQPHPFPAMIRAARFQSITDRQPE